MRVRQWVPWGNRCAGCATDRLGSGRWRHGAFRTHRDAGIAAQALIAYGWTLGDSAISTDPVDLAVPGRMVISPDGPAHARRVTTLMDGGAIALFLCLDADGALKTTVPVPIDRTLPLDPAILAGFQAPLVVPVADSQPSQRCEACHQTAHTSWLASAHARAWTSLAAADKTTACASCHVTRLPAGGVAAHVHCQACHTGAETHANTGGTVRTSGAVDCRSCHDATHDPGFDPVAAWLRMQHGR